MKGLCIFLQLTMEETLHQQTVQPPLQNASSTASETNDDENNFVTIINGLGVSFLTQNITCVAFK